MTMLPEICLDFFFFLKQPTNPNLMVVLEESQGITTASLNIRLDYDLPHSAATNQDFVITC